MSTDRSLPNLWHHRYRNEVGVLLALLAVTPLFPGSIPLGVYVVGLVAAAALSLNAVAVVLVYKANRFAHFAQVGLSIFCAAVFASLVQGQFFLNVARSVCGCVSRRPEGLSLTVNYGLAAATAIALGAALSVGFYMTLLRRFSSAPRLMLTLFTIFAAQALDDAREPIRDWFVPRENREEIIASRPLSFPWDFEWTIDRYARLGAVDLAMVIVSVAVVVAVGRYLRGTRTGAAIRAASENPERASTLGVDVPSVTSRVWLVAGVIAGVTGVLASASSGSQMLSQEVVMIVLFIAVLAGFESLPIVLLGGAVYGVLRLTVPFSFQTAAPLEASMVFVVGGVLLLRRHRRSRADRDDTTAFEVSREVRPIPKELRNLPQIKAWVRNLAILGTLVVLAIPWVLPGSRTGSLTVFVIFVLVGFSIIVLTGWAGQVTLGQFGFAAIGAWAAAVSRLPLPFAVLFGAVIGAVAAVVVGYPAMRLRGLSVAVTTLAFAVSASVLFVGDRFLGGMLPDSLQRPSVLGMDFDDARVYYYAMVLVVVVAALGMTGLRRSRTGRALIALRANEEAAQAFGISPTRLRLTAFAVSGFLAAAAGGFYAFHQGTVDPSAFTVDKSLEVFVFSVVGGLGGLAGPIAGFSLMAVTDFFAANPVMAFLSGGVGAMMIVLASPGGIAQILYDVRDAGLRRLAVRLRIPVPSLMGDKAAARTLERAPLEEGNRARRSGIALPLRYRLPHQWALDRFAEESVRRPTMAGSAAERAAP